MRVCVVGAKHPEDPGQGTVEPALQAAAAVEGDTLEIVWVDPAAISADGVLAHLKDADGVFGAPGPVDEPDGYIDAIEFAREGQLPYFGAELGMDLAVVEFARRMLTLPAAHSFEFDTTPRDAVVVDLVPPPPVKGKAVELTGDLPVRFVKDSRLREWMGVDASMEIHRARYGVAAKYKNALYRAGLKLAATDETQFVLRAMELTGHPFFVITAFAPQLRPLEAGAHPLLKAFLDAIGGRL